jgi:glutathione reductase (NADPH)
MWNAGILCYIIIASIAEALGDAESYGFRNVSRGTFDWNALKIKRDAYIKRLNG